MYLYHEDAFPQSVYRKKVLSMLLSISNKIHFTYQYVHVPTCTAKKTVIREKATIRNSTMNILIMFSMDLSIILLI